MKPVIILPPDQMNSTHMTMLRENGFCVVVAKDPSKVEFVDTISCVTSRTEIEAAAIKLSRKLLNPGAWNPQNWTSNDSEMRANISKMYVDILINGTPLDPKGSKEEKERAIFDQAKREELERLAREEARAERAAKKAKQLEQPK